MRRSIISAALAVVTSSASASTVVYTLTLGDNGSGVPTHNSFAVYAQASADNAGIMGLAVDLHNANFTTLVNTLPAAQIRLPSDPPDMTRSWGFPTGRTASISAGLVSGLQNFADRDMVPLYGFGQGSGTFPPGYVILSQQGNVPFNGRALIARGTWSTGCPAFQVGSVDNAVNTFNSTSGLAVTRADLRFHQNSLVPLPCVVQHSIISTINTRLYTNRSLGNLIYGGKINQLIGDAAATGSAEMEGGDDEVGSSYFMARLTGTDDQIAAALDAEPYSISVTDPKFKELQTIFGGQFGGTGFNALFEIPNIPGPKILNWDFSNYPGVAVDQLAVVPEPGLISLISVGGYLVLRRKRSR